MTLTLENSIQTRQSHFRCSIYLMYDVLYSMSGPGIVISSIDNMPAQLPRESTDLFGAKLLPHIEEFVSGLNKLQTDNILMFDITNSLKWTPLTHWSLNMKYRMLLKMYVTTAVVAISIYIVMMSSHQAIITHRGKLTEKFEYIEQLRKNQQE